MDAQSPYQKQIDSWNRAAEHSRRIAGFVRKMAAWIRGDEPPPDGMKRADVFKRVSSPGGTSWAGWEWTKRGCLVSFGEFQSRVAECNAAFRQRLDSIMAMTEEGRRMRGPFDPCFDRPPPKPFQSMIDRMRDVLEAINEYQAALVEESLAWDELEKVAQAASETLPLDEIEAAQARIAAEEREAQAEAAPAVRIEGAVNVAGIYGLYENAAIIAANTTVLAKKKKDREKVGMECGKDTPHSANPETVKALARVDARLKADKDAGRKPNLAHACRKVCDGFDLAGKRRFPPLTHVNSNQRIKPDSLERMWRERHPKSTADGETADLADATDRA